jgi:PAS domain S-box-containing protein
MRFNDGALTMTNHIPTAIDDPMRLRALRTLGLLDAPIEPGFDRLATLAARLLGAPIALISFIEPDRQFVLGEHGLAEPFASEREILLSHSICQYVVTTNAPLIVSDARDYSLLARNGAVTEYNVIAYAGFPLYNNDGHILGALCVIDTTPRGWNTAELETLRALTETVAAHIMVCRTALASQQAERFEAARRRCMEGLAEGWELSAILNELARGMEREFSDGLCAVMLLDRTRQRLVTGAAPSLPVAFSAAVEGAEIGPNAGSCGTAVYFDRLVVSEDITRDERWAPWAELTAGFGLRACWSLPFHDSEGTILGTFAIYHTQPFRPLQKDIALAQEAAAVAALGVERWRTRELLREREAALRESQANLATLLDHIADPIWSVDREYRLVQFNRVFRELSTTISGFLPQVGSTVAQHLTHEDFRTWKLCYDRALGGEHFNTELYAIIEDKEIWFDVAFHPVFVEGSAVGVVVFARDITARKHQEEQRLLLERSWQETQRLESLGVLAGGIAHDFNNLLAAVQGNLGLALLDTVRESEAWQRLQQAEQIVQHAAALTQQLLAYSGKGQITIRLLNLNQVVEELTDLVRAALPQPVPIRYDLRPELPAIEADQAQLQQVVMNLLVNAAEAVGSKIGAITVTTQLMDTSSDSHPFGSSLEAGRYVTLIVEDTGCGMDKPTLSRMFEPFFSTKFTGRGLGLAAVQGIIRSHKGAIHVESTVGKGTRILVALPAVERQVEEKLTPPPSVISRIGGDIVLVIDDESQVRQIAVRMLERLSYRVLDAESASEGLEILAQLGTEISCVLLDWTMPGQSGAATVRQLRESYPSLPIVVMSGYNAVEIDRQIGKAGIDGFLQKPFRLNDLQSTLGKACSIKMFQTAIERS